VRTWFFIIAIFIAIFGAATDGCIAVTNEEMDEIWRTVADGTPIEIRP
jgi:L,D-peptidoglycan transpeptidase YkuD (ErfK/YbiS/YcfS/YnhG family)